MPMAIASRYARALADVVGRTGEYRRVLSELEDFDAVYRESAELREVFETPAIPLPQKIKVLEAILVRLGSSSATSNFFRVLVAHYRMRLLREICPAFLKIVNERLGIVRVKVFSASNISEAERQVLRFRFGELTRQQVELEFHLNPDLLGGIVAQVESTVYDGSVRGNLQSIRQQLMAW